MSVDTPAGDGSERRSDAACGICGDPTVHGDDRHVACYATDGVAVPSVADRDGVLVLCADCADEVAELTVAWDDQARPPVTAERTIAESYHAAADGCSFCEDDVDDDPVLGVESWDSGTSAGLGPEASAHYALCANCVPIFAEFLRGIHSEAE